MIKQKRAMSPIITMVILLLVLMVSASVVWWYYQNILGGATTTAQAAALASIDITDREIRTCQLILRYTGNVSKCDVSMRQQVAKEIFDLTGVNIYDIDWLNIPGDPGFDTNGTLVTFEGTEVQISTLTCLDANCTSVYIP